MGYKLANCGRCGLEPVTRIEELSDTTAHRTCPACRIPFVLDAWNAAQFAARTERINAAAAAICAGGGTGSYLSDVTSAAMLIDTQDAAARARWAEMQKGE